MGGGGVVATGPQSGVGGPKPPPWAKGSIGYSTKVHILTSSDFHQINDYFIISRSHNRVCVTEDESCRR